MDLMFFWNWLRAKKYTHAEVRELVEKIKQYNSGVTDDHLSRYIEHTFETWTQER